MAESDRALRMLKSITLLLAVILCSAGLAAAEETPQQFEGFTLSGFNGTGQKSWDVKGDSADILGETIKIKNIVANNYGEDVMHLTAKDGTMNKTSGNMFLENDVIITTESGATLVTDSLNWERDVDLVSTDDEVVIKKESMLAVGKGAKANPGLNAAQLNEEVSVTVDVESKDKGKRKITITCDGPLEINYEEQNAIFNNNVVAVDGDRRLLADKMEVFFDSQSNKITEMICTGNVKIFQGDNASYSEKAVYKAEHQRVILSGRPKLIFYAEEGSDVSFGDE
ncbi:MAG: LPS export ABC transporter periplasmic protein LptC [Candidatus Omnitrophota bacterium]